MEQTHQGQSGLWVSVYAMNWLCRDHFSGFRLSITGSLNNKLTGKSMVWLQTSRGNKRLSPAGLKWWSMGPLLLLCRKQTVQLGLLSKLPPHASAWQITNLCNKLCSDGCIAPNAGLYNEFYLTDWDSKYNILFGEIPISRISRCIDTIKKNIV